MSKSIYLINPNPDEPEPKKALLQNFLLNIQEFHWLGPNTDIHRQKIVDAVALGPKLITQKKLLAGIRWLGNRLHHPVAFKQRVLQFIQNYQIVPEVIPQFRKTHRKIDAEMLEVVRNVRRLGVEEFRIFSEITTAVHENPATQWHILQMMFEYRQILHMYAQGQFWKPLLAGYSAPNLTETLVQIDLI
ncbi:MAG: hypothetical protein GY934_08350 [Gammaproteobacteria bacterium]|nr:hypothetical protein [Gammaproteobacteria bacterium]